MKKTFSVLLSFCIVLISAQIKFEKGYIISSNDVRKEILIKNQGWANNPDSFTYKMDEASGESTGNPSTIKEFGIYNDVKYVTYNGDIDYSSDNTGDLSSIKEPEFKKASVFLKEIATGNKNLYSYQGRNVIRYFYSDSDSSIKPLIYKKYFFNGNNLQVATNEEYIDQLKTIFSNDNVAQAIAPKTKYTSNDLKKIFSTYNSKFSGTTNEENVSETKRNSKLNLAVRPGLNFYSPLEITKTLSNEGAPSKTGFRIGVEAEIVLPFNRGKWSVVAEPTFSLYNNKTAIRTTNGNLYNINVENYSFISIPLSVRHYMFINDKSKIFINAGINLLTLKTSSAKDFSVDYDGYVFDRLKLSSSQAFKSAVFGIGYNYNNKYILEARYNTGMNLFEEKGAEANLKYASIILGYNIF
ncbi:PorT family protein [Chryseobacterium viscerum]|uniref:PorT family protein n=1 Tax=Chryseobacterium TaxID=59732 RepID=UPI0022234A44|nr:PorT family protein [Chryseobacterium viscerum]MCW1960864.1 PorT family protein [Chryseobacterium viscerum]WPO92016.1 PorT family protein [Chryseobacterium sp. HR92]